MTAPSTPGHYIGQWKLRNASGGTFGLGAGAAYTFFVDINVAPSYASAYDFIAHAGEATWTTGAGTFSFPGTDGSANGYALKVDSPQLESGTVDNAASGLLTVPQNTAGGFIKAVYPAFVVQTGDRFQSIVNCGYGATNCYVNFRLNYKIGSGVEKTLWSFNERYEGLYYRTDINLNALAGQSVNFILYVADVNGRGSPAGDKALWVGPQIARTGSGATVTSGPTPTNQTGCTNRGQFIKDVTIPDGTSMSADTHFTKTWQIKNVGTCTWTTAYSLVLVYGDALGAANSKPLAASVAPGQTADFSIDMTVPTTPGHYLSYWRFKNASGAQFGVGSGMITFFADIYATAAYNTAYDFYDHACEATWTSAAGTLPCPGTDGDAKGFVLKLDAPKLEDGTTGPHGLLTFPQNVTDGYIQAVYPPVTIQSGDRFQSIINCQYGATGCYVTFQVSYMLDGSGTIVTLKTFREKIEGLYYRLDLNLSSLSGKNVKFILKVLATGSPSGDRALWSGPIIARPGTVAPTATSGPSPTASLTPTTGPSPTASPTPTLSQTPSYTPSPTTGPSSTTGPSPTESSSGDTITVFFQDVNAFNASTPPYEVGVSRPVSESAEGEPQDVLNQLFLGPTTDEFNAGLRLVSSGATGYDQFTFDAGTGVASLRLTGGCSSGGSTYTIANLINKNLKQYEGIEFVKIYAPDGTTETPGGASDSIPACLEP
jgi:hypothetical protein